MVEIFDLILKLLPKQYVIYDFNSFMADWGGYMGLVLGYREIHDSMLKVEVAFLRYLCTK